eukprot:TRINITY_DN98484_c0_g1_i1.p1 TRINITY_DN98484_c0_g1~~TRINITY_DN98484_c0_g1_i1.p1  ORF type:complete len:260 (+),score=24.88 TRINITY_DN98484_c0_g1_i1:39-818(+)
MESLRFFIGGLPSEIDDAQLYNHFQPYGQVVEAVVQRTREGASRGFGFVTFAHPPQPTLFSSPVVVLGRTVSVKTAVAPSDMRNSPPPATSYDATTTQPALLRRLFVGGIPRDLSEEGLRHVFAPLGNVLSAEIMHSSVTGLSRGFGFVTFASVEDVDTVLATFSGFIGDRPVSLKKASPPAAPPSSVTHADAAHHTHAENMAHALTYTLPPADAEPDWKAKYFQEREMRLELERKLSEYESHRYGGPLNMSAARFRPY